jgi:hypothetical protein
MILDSEEDKKGWAKEVAKTALRDPVYFCHFFLSHWFPRQMPWVHRGILSILTRRTDFLLKYGELDKIERHFVWKENPNDPQSPEHPIFHIERDAEGNPTRVKLIKTKYTLIMMPRGFSKTTLTNAVTLYYILFQQCEFPVYLSEAATHAEMQLQNVRAELETNERIHTVFGELKPAQREGLKWSGDMIETVTSVVVAARGRGAQVRGLNHRGRRPDQIVLDDVEDKESVGTPEQRLKARRWFYSDVIPALPELKENSSITALGTLLHSEALLQVLRADPEWTTIVFGALDRDGEPLWADNMSVAKLERKRQSYAQAAMLSEFYMEYFNQIRADETAKFRPDFFKYGLPAEEITHNAIALDPAISDKPDADFSAICVVGMTQGGGIVVQESWGKRGATPREQINRFFELARRWGCVRFGVEAVAYQAALIHFMREEMFRQKFYFEPEKLTHKQKKTERVEGILQPRYAAGVIWHRVRQPELESQLLDWPNGKMDFPDALSMAVALLDPYAAQAADPTIDLGEDEYEPIDVELGGDWRANV